MADTLIYIDLPYYVSYYLVTKRCFKGLVHKPEGWPEGCSILKGTLASYKTLRLCPKFWNADFLHRIKSVSKKKSLHVIRTVAELNNFVDRHVRGNHKADISWKSWWSNADIYNGKLYEEGCLKTYVSWGFDTLLWCCAICWLCQKVPSRFWELWGPSLRSRVSIERSASRPILCCALPVVWKLECLRGALGRSPRCCRAGLWIDWLRVRSYRFGFSLCLRWLSYRLHF